MIARHQKSLSPLSVLSQPLLPETLCQHLCTSLDSDSLACQKIQISSTIKFTKEWSIQQTDCQWRNELKKKKEGHVIYARTSTYILLVSGSHNGKPRCIRQLCKLLQGFSDSKSWPPPSTLALYTYQVCPLLKHLSMTMLCHVVSLWQTLGQIILKTNRLNYMTTNSATWAINLSL